MRVLISGFGAFEGVESNPTEGLVRRLVAEPPEGLELGGDVLPVSFARAPLAWDELLEREGAPDVLLALGVSARATSFHLEARARAQPQPPQVRADNDGAALETVAPASHEDLESTLDVEALAESLRTTTRQPVEVSRDAGAYVCERTYHHVLWRARERGIAGLFVHVPPFEVIGEADQLSFLRALLVALRA